MAAWHLVRDQAGLLAACLIGLALVYFGAVRAHPGSSEAGGASARVASAVRLAPGDHETSESLGRLASSHAAAEATFPVGSGR
ncbi:MAG: hypothetical protein SFZ23_16300 [Planctomycetota bacterium]|nr:hypothetical protein [Planctomycetota bacterium]